MTQLDDDTQRLQRGFVTPDLIDRFRLDWCMGDYDLCHMQMKANTKIWKEFIISEGKRLGRQK